MSKKQQNSKFHLEFLSTAQKLAWMGFQQHDVMFMIGPAGVGKSHVSMAFAIHEILQGTKKRIILTRPIVESGESLGYLPGNMAEKVNPYMLPLFDCLHTLVLNIEQSKKIEAAIELAPIAYMRGRTFSDAVAIFDEAQNATKMQLKLFLSRLGKDSKIIVNGDPSQSDIGNKSGLMDVIHRLETVTGVSIIKFGEDSIVRHPLVSAILAKLED